MMANCLKSATDIAREEWELYLDRRETGMDTQESYDRYRDALDAADIIPTLAGYKFKKQD